MDSADWTAASQFKRAKFPDLQPRAYRIAQGFDSAAAIVIDGEIRAAAAEERFTREKATGAFPIKCDPLLYRARTASIYLRSITLHTAFVTNPTEASSKRIRTRARNTGKCIDAKYKKSCSRNSLELRMRRRSLSRVPHHVAHAASAYYPSGFSDALILVSDGMGEVDSMTVFSARGTDLTALTRVPAAHSLGSLYGVFTLYLGFKFNMDEYKIMGLAPHGNPARLS